MRVDGPYGPRFDGPSAQGFLGLTQPAAVRVVVSPGGDEFYSQRYGSAFPTLRVILSRRRRISVHGVSDSHQPISSLYPPAHKKLPAPPEEGYRSPFGSGGSFSIMFSRLRRSISFTGHPAFHGYAQAGRAAVLRFSASLHT